MDAAKEKALEEQVPSEGVSPATEGDLRKDGSPPEEAAGKPSLTPLEATIILARRGCKEILLKLGQVLDEHPELWRTYGNLSGQAQASWIDMIGGRDLLLTEWIRRYSEAMQVELVGPNPSPLEKLLVQRVISCWLQMEWCDAMEAQRAYGQNIKLAEFQMKRAAQAHRDYLTAMKMLATVRNLLVKTNTIQVELVHRTAAQATTRPIIDGPVNGEEPNGSTGQTTPQAGVNGAKPINRLNGTTGRNRFGSLLEAASSK